MFHSRNHPPEGLHISIISNQHPETSFLQGSPSPGTSTFKDPFYSNIECGVRHCWFAYPIPISYFFLPTRNNLDTVEDDNVTN